jgi:D-alanyl-D-alanine carboxypeptidase (penicillin-binding protein 5/6)
MAVEGVGSLGGVRPTAVMPLASVTKLVTALVVLAKHPLAPGQSGPTIRFTATDAEAYRTDLDQDQSVIAVSAGEALSEEQALEAMLIPSADNVARVLARWSAGSEPRFVAEMNREAVRLGLRGVHFVGPSGLNPGSVGTAAAMVRLGAAVMANPVLRSIVSMPSVTLPVAGTVANYDSVLGQEGIVGVKTGSTSAAGGNFVFAAIRRIHGRRATVIGAILGAGGADPLRAALDEAVALSAAAAAAVRPYVVLPAGSAVARLRPGWAAPVTLRTTRALQVMAVPGQRLSLRLRLSRAGRAGRTRGFAAGQRLASVTLSDGQQQVSVAAVAARRLGPPSPLYRLTRL